MTLTLRAAVTEALGEYLLPTTAGDAVKAWLASDEVLRVVNGGMDEQTDIYPFRGNAEYITDALIREADAT